MIVRKRISFRIILKYSGKKILLMLLHATAVTLLYYYSGWKFLSISPAAAGILGTAIAILLGFRNNSAYDRWWEARKLWGSLLNESRSFTRQVMTFLSLKHCVHDATEHEMQSFKREIVFRQIAFAHALRCHLRRERMPDELQKYLPEEEFAVLSSSINIPNMILQKQAHHLHTAVDIGYIEDFRHMQMDFRLTAMTDILGGCERIKNTVFPRQYSNYTSIFTWIFIIMLPYSLVNEIGPLTIVAATAIGFIFMVLETIGYYIENPFENHINDTPMTSLCRTIEINLLEQLGETDLPKPLEPVHGYLY